MLAYYAKMMYYYAGISEKHSGSTLYFPTNVVYY